MLDMFIWGLCGWGGNAIILCSLGDHRYKGLKLATFWSLVVLGNAIITALLYKVLPSENFIPVALVTAMVLEILPYLCTTTGHWGKRLFFVLNSTCVVAIIGVVTIKYCPPISATANLTKVVLCLLFVFVYLRFVREPLEITIRDLDRHWLWLNGMGVIFSTLFYYTIVGYIFGNMTLFHLLAVMVMNIVVYVGMFYTLHYMSAAVNLSQSKLQEETLLGQVERLMDIEEQSRIMRHDLRHHNQAITSFLQNGQHQELLDYLQEYDQSLTAENQPAYCNHPLINNILGVYHAKAQEAGVNFKPQVSLSANCTMNQRDLLGLLSNLLENSLHGCNGNGEINLKLFSQGRKLIIVCQNTALEPVNFQEGIPQAKKRKSGGITSIMRTVNRYDGMADFSLCQEVFTAHIVLNLK